MSHPIDRHIGEETLEKYAMKLLSDKIAANVEEHLLVCEACRQNLTATDAHVAAMAKAAAKLRKAPRKSGKTGTRKAGR